MRSFALSSALTTAARVSLGLSLSLLSCRSHDGPSSCEEPTTWNVDVDGDGFGSDQISLASCEAPQGFVAASDALDCDDAAPDVNPDGTELCNGEDDNCDGVADEGVALTTFYADADGDGYGDAGKELEGCEAPDGAVADNTDCDDADAAFHPGASETDCADPLDYNCDGEVGLSDVDEDGYAACEDCDDHDDSVNPAGIERCNDVDDDCNGSVDDEPVDATKWYADSDGDGFGVVSIVACDAGQGWVAFGGDCDDGDVTFHPYAAETDCTSTIDYNCDESTGYADADNDGFDACDDCNDQVATVNRNAQEVCNGLDDNCNGESDEGGIGAVAWFPDADGDGHGNASQGQITCSIPLGHVTVGDDCDDTDAALHPGAVESCDAPVDLNCDGSKGSQDVDGDLVVACLDCNDADADVKPSGTELCNGIDDDCDGNVDENATDRVDYFADSDGDGFGDVADSVLACSAPAGYVDNSLDCKDLVATINPDAVELCNGIDDNCDDAKDGSDAADRTLWYADGDADTHGRASDAGTLSCAAPTLGAVHSKDDCDDTKGAVYPGATEACNTYDDDCDGKIDEAGATGATVWNNDADRDGFGDASLPQTACVAPVGYVADGTDCDDLDNDVNPAAVEMCNLQDDDCNTIVDDDYAIDAGDWYDDSDLDGYGNASVTAPGCSAPAGTVANARDCADGDPSVNPAATERCDASNVDEDCDGVADNGDPSATGKSTYYADGDADTYRGVGTSSQCDAGGGYPLTSAAGLDCNDAAASVNPGKAEICNGIDDNCGGGTDEGVLNTYYLDNDNDEYGQSASTTTGCSLVAGYAAVGGDCNDVAVSGAAINPGSQEVCDASNVDEDCDSLTDNADPSAQGKTRWYADVDADTYGAGAGALQCDAGGGFSSVNNTDCNDAAGKGGINPGATEACDSANVDEDCDGLADNADPSAAAGGKTTFYTDGDGDTYRGAGTASQCDAGGVYPLAAAAGLDCNDSNSSVNPSKAEICNGIDDNCNSTVDDGVCTPPTIGNIADQSILVNTPTSALAFTVGDLDTPPGSLTVIGYSSNSLVVANSGISLGGSGANRTVTVTPVTGATGTATITVTVSDGTATATDTFVVTVAVGGWIASFTASPANGGQTVYRLSARALPAGDARAWYRDQCTAVGKRPVSCDPAFYSSAYDASAWNAVRMYQPYWSCNVSSGIQNRTGWTDILTYHVPNGDAQGVCQNGCTITGSPVYPVCTD